MKEMSTTKTLTIYLLTGPYTSQCTDIALDIAEKALNKGYKANLFLYMDAVHVPKKGQKTLRFPKVEERLRKLISIGLRVKACVRCASARGYVEGEQDKETGTFPTTQYVNGASITSIYDFSDWIKESDKVITLGE